jgi:multidrug efflux pump subunit AcrB
MAAGAVAAGLALCPVSNYAITGNFALTPGGSSFLVGRLVHAPHFQRFAAASAAVRAVHVAVVFLLLLAQFQGVRLALTVLSTVPAVLAGVVLALRITGTTLNLESAIGAIMAVGVAVANAILLVTFAERSRQSGATPVEAALAGAVSRLRPILMTGAAMIAGMIPMALGLGEGGPQTGPLGRAVAGGLVGASVATLGVLPAVFALLAPRTFRSASLDPEDPASPHFVKALFP